VRAIVIAVLLAACGRGGDAGSGSPALERSIAQGLTAQLGVEVAHVTCGGSRCTAALAGGGSLSIAVHDRDWQLDGLVIATAPLEQYLALLCGDLGLNVKPACGARAIAVAPGDRVECRLGDLGRAFATIRDGGDFTIELAIGGDAVTAREAQADEAALDRASLALDHGAATTDEGDQVEPDGGAPP
jgi:hypothetical protein